jgi:BirA family transcriptional regulator, biotin operon repressor / biotin---[acetyl-CoA-carboxylase] ligase
MASREIDARWLGIHRVELDACGSTNDEAARLARAGAVHGTVVIARAQSAGRGREGRAWASPVGGLYLSAVVRPPLPLAEVPFMTLAIGVALCDAVRAYAPAAALKWPNDVLVGSRKLAGVLVESQSRGNRLDAVIVGVGINLVDPKAFAPLPATPAGRPRIDPRASAPLPATPAGLPPSGGLPDELGAITLAEAGTFAPADRERFVTALCGQLERWIDRYVAAGRPAIVVAWHERMAHGLSARATVEGAPLVGEVAGLDDDGALLLRDDHGQLHRVLSGDVEVMRLTRAAVAQPSVLRPGE